MSFDVGPLRGVRRRAEQTPPDRDRHIDLLRAVSILLVVTGHWFAVAVTYDAEQGFGGRNALEVMPWAHSLTWLFQVMPIFFLVGGYANAASLSSHLRRGGDGAGWLIGRGIRLLRPTVVLLAVVAAGSLAARLAGVGQDAAGLGAWFVTIPLWFLAAYVATVALAPPMYALHRRWGLAVPIALVAAVAAADVLRLGADVPYVGASTFLTAWLAVHQLGMAWRDGLLPSRRSRAALLAAGGFVATVVLTTAGPYPVRMVAVPGETLENTSPPTLALLALAVAQTGIALFLHDPVNRALRRIRLWTAVVAVNAVILTVFLWHMAAALVAALVLYPTGIFPQPEIGSGPWLLLKVPWLIALAGALVFLVAAVGWAELRSARWTPARQPAGWRSRALTVVGIAAAVAGLVFVALAGPDDHGPAGLPTYTYVAVAVGLLLLELARAHTASE